MPAITSANVAQAIVKLVAADALPALVGNLVMGNLVNRTYERTLAAAGDTVNVPIAPQLVANNIAEAGSVATQNPSLGNAQIVLNTHAEATFQIPDVTQLFVAPDLLATFMNPAVIAIAEKIEKDLLAMYALFTANTAVGSSATITEAVLSNAETALFNAKIPGGQRKILIVGDSPYGALRQIPRFTELQTAGYVINGQPSPIAEGTLLRGMSFDIFRSQYVTKVSTLYHNLAFVRDSIGLVVRRLPMPLPNTGAIAEYAEMGNFGMRVTMSYAPNTLAQQFTVDCLYGCAPLRQNFAVDVQST
jgi:P22 coat protein - gene protein 5